jgi:hypothetical protein
LAGFGAQDFAAMSFGAVPRDFNIYVGWKGDGQGRITYGLAIYKNLMPFHCAYEQAGDQLVSMVSALRRSSGQQKNTGEGGDPSIHTRGAPIHILSFGLSCEVPSPLIHSLRNPEAKIPTRVLKTCASD